MTSPVSCQNHKNFRSNGKKRKGTATRTPPRQTNGAQQQLKFKQIKGYELVKYGKTDDEVPVFERFFREGFNQLRSDNIQSILRVLLTMQPKHEKVVRYIFCRIPEECRIVTDFTPLWCAMESTSVCLILGSVTKDILMEMKWEFDHSEKEEAMLCNVTTLPLSEASRPTSIRSLTPNFTIEMDLQHALFKECESNNSISVRPCYGQTKTSFDVKSSEQKSDGKMEIETNLNCVDRGSNHHTPNGKIEICHRQVNDDDIKKVFEQSSLEEMNLRDCDVNLGFLRKLLDEMKRKKMIEIKSLGVTATENIDDFIETICELMKECKATELNLEESSGTGKMVKRLHENINKSEIQLRSLNLSYNKDINDFEELGRLLSNRVIELHLVNCDLTPNDIKNLTKLKHGKVQYLDISFNDEIDEESVHNLLALLTNERPVSIVMQGCDLTEDELDGFEKDGDNDDIKIKMLDLSHNQSLESDGVGKVGKIVKERQTTELRLSSCNLDEDCLESLCDNLTGHELQSLDLSHNAGISSHSEKIVKLIKVSNVRSLNMSDCRMTSSQIDRLVTCLKKNGVKLKEINMSDSERRRIDQKYITAIRKLSEFTEKGPILKLPHVSTTERDNLENLQVC